MCMGKSKSSQQQAPAPTPVANPHNVADASNAAQRQAVVASQSNGTPSFGSELGNPTTATQ